ncbi:polysaccharide deacetylase family protein [Fulvivirga sp. 29W222]|uniref:Polysaccharide deacetylase family protein n=1 Tax=Fulvivirga marina TaxID=2494733 RepID=A0A937FV34_9BACT|nr:polysaccharide deacetylase family protein [Fulvivirga marina]MBL6444771.1 polysaccharide deacetylase family protein [Fulvivirga marina]
MKRSIFTISLDFELHWGGFEKWPLNDSYRTYFLNTRNSIPTLLSLFLQSGLHVTWATVGLLMHRNRSELLANLPAEKPDYERVELSAYHFMKTNTIGENEKEDPFHYAASILDQIMKVPGQEVGTHTFAHYYCNEKGQNATQFQHDLRSANKAAAGYGVTLRSLVFPRNQYNSDYLKACKKEGVEIVRVNPLDWWWQIHSTQRESKWKRLNRGIDAYFSIGGKTSFTLDSIKKENGIILLPASRLLRPYNSKELFLNKLKIKKIKNEMTRAAKNNEVYHLWWHPHNFGNFTQENLHGLVEIANHYQKLHHDFGMQSMNMGEIADCLN